MSNLDVLAMKINKLRLQFLSVTANLFSASKAVNRFAQHLENREWHAVRTVIASQRRRRHK